MKFAFTIEYKISGDTLLSGSHCEATNYIIRIPNYMQVDQEVLIEAIKTKMEKSHPGVVVKLTEYAMLSDTAMTQTEKNQLDFSEKLTYNPTELHLTDILPTPINTYEAA